MLPENGPDPRRWKALTLLCAAFFMGMLDSSIVLVALPSIGPDLGFASGDLQWVLSAYALTFAGLLLLGGRCADLLGARRLLMIGTGLFALSSLLCGLAWTPGALIAARGVQGISAALMTPAAMSLLTITFPEGGERNKALGIWGATGAVGGTAGWLIGGPLTSGLGWGWIFFINLPVALAMVALAPRLLNETPTTGRRDFDVAGAVTVTAALVLLVYGVGKAPEVGWGSVQTLGLLALSAALTAAFVAVEAHTTAPLLPLGVLRSRTLVGGNLVLIALGMSAFGMPFVLTQYAQELLGFSPFGFGASFAVMPIGVIFGSTVGQSVAGRTGYRPVIVAGMALIGAGSLLLTRTPVHGSYVRDILPALLLGGPGVGAAFAVGSIATLAGVAKGDSGLASGLSNTSFQVGLALGVAIVSTVMVSSSGGHTGAAALHHGFQAAFAATIAFAAAGVVIAFVVLGRTERRRKLAPVTVT